MGPAHPQPSRSPSTAPTCQDQTWTAGLAVLQERNGSHVSGSSGAGRPPPRPPHQRGDILQLALSPSQSSSQSPRFQGSQGTWLEAWTHPASPKGAATPQGTQHWGFLRVPQRTSHIRHMGTGRWVWGAAPPQECLGSCPDIQVLGPPLRSSPPSPPLPQLLFSFLC